VTTERTGDLRVYAPHGHRDLFWTIVRPHPRLTPRHVDETTTARWARTWPELTVLPWAGNGRVGEDAGR
jgi:hypothetical protein